MAIGQITAFPINTILEFATSGQHGLSPKFDSSIPAIATADRNSPASERAIRLALDAMNQSLSYTNLGAGAGVFESLSGDIALYRSLSAHGTYTAAFSVGDNVFISGAAQDSIIIPTTGGVPPSVQGGKYQYSNTFDLSAMTTTGIVIASPVANDVIGKIFVKTITDIDDVGQKYSIGTAYNQYSLAVGIEPTGSNELTENWRYGQALSGKEYWLVPSGMDILLYQYMVSTAPVSGQLGISIFYDHIEWDPTYGYAMGDGESAVLKFNLTLDTTVASDRGALLQSGPSYLSYGARSYTHYIYIAGGNFTSTDIQRYNTKTDTTSPLNRGALPSNVYLYQNQLASSSTKMYLMGGYIHTTNYYTITKVNNFQFSNDTATAVYGSDLNVPRMGGVAWSSSTYAYVGGGQNWQSGFYIAEYNTIEKMSFASDTTWSVIAATLNSANRSGVGTFRYSSTYTYLVGGNYYNSGVGVIAPNTSKFNMSTDGITHTSNMLWSTMKHLTYQTSTYGYAGGGQYYRDGYSAAYANNLYSFQKMEFATETYTAIDLTIPRALGYESGDTV